MKRNGVLANPQLERSILESALAIARQGIAGGQSPFGAVIFSGHQIVAVTHNTVWQTTDPTAHAEVNCIRAAAKAKNSISLADCEMFSTTEPCPMCLSAIHWAKIRRVVYGASIADAAAAGFTELTVPAKELARMGKSRLIVEALADPAEFRQLFADWRSAGISKSY